VSTTGRPSFVRQEPPDIAALRQLKRAQPDLGVAVDLQIDILTHQRRTQSRLTTPWIDRAPDALAASLARGEPVLRFDEVAFDWTEVRVLFRQLVDVLQRHDMIDAAEHAAVQELVRASHPATAEARAWFESRSRRLAAGAAYVPPHGDTFDQVLALSAQPFVERASESLRSKIDLSAWARPYCPICGADPEMASLPPDGSRRLHCGGCAAAWAFDADRCPHCDSIDRRQLVSYAGADARYRILACNACRRYLKAVDVRRAERPLMLAVDTIATLPLDAAAARQGYSG
jgi:FdhE protein